MVGDAAAAVGVAHLDPLRFVPLDPHRQLLRGRAAAAGVDGGVLEQQQDVGDLALLARSLAAALRPRAPPRRGRVRSGQPGFRRSPLKSLHGAPLYPWRSAHGPVQGTPTRLAPGRRAQRRAGRRDAGLEPAGRRPRRPGLPHRAVRSAAAWRSGTAAGTAATTPHLQRPLPAAGGAARAAAWSAALAVVASSYLFDRLVRDRWGEAARWATLWFAAGVVTLLADGQLTFALGVAFGLAALRSLRSGQRRAARRCAAAAAACALSPARSPPSSSPASSAVGARSERGRPPRRPRPRALASPSLAARPSVLIPNLAFPERRPVPLRLLLLRRDPALVRLGALPHPRPAARSGSCAGSSPPTCSPRPSIWLVPNAMGGNAVRLGALFGGPVLAAVVLARRPRVAAWFLALVPGRRPLLAGDRERQPDRPQRRRPLDQRRLLRAARRTGCATTAATAVRIEVPPTANHWESAYLAPRLRARPRLAAPARHDPRRHLLRATSRSPTPPTAPGCATTRSASSPCPTRRSTTPRSPSGG